MVNDNFKTIIVVPAYNEAIILEKVLSELVNYFNPQQIVVVDDGSSDETYLIAQKLGAHALQHSINRGAGAATKTGIVYAFNYLQADAIVTFDADGQHDHRDVQNLIQPIAERRADVVIGSRFLIKQDIPLLRIVANWLANLFTFLLFGLWVSDSQTGFKAISRLAWDKIEIHGDRFEFCSEIVAEIKKNKLKYVEIPVKVYYSKYSQSKGQNFFVGFKTLIRIIVNSLSK
ncbi:MAG: glycosyltransferase family 2 protein [Patescibacteria group bacterium]|nr:glycosyltransferase family 2 protein [Patescibacteria group bacterium]MDD5121030.1 glycosyltransferase family 2 protein [Patescibacteria group bacterium]MDD5221609.1 glycosyltransferase family 2 protein [Patescibacteria group bacterium]MDD5396051.1 glycosyltransferase family 2 protein [Patescibacteria group bacterium]